MASIPIPLAAPRHARRYAPEAVRSLLGGIAEESRLGLLLDLDALERSAVARLDRVMQLALDALADGGVHVVLLAAGERTLDEVRATMPGARWIVISDDGELLSQTTSRDRAVVLGRSEAASLRATLWWLVDERRRVLSART